MCASVYVCVCVFLQVSLGLDVGGCFSEKTMYYFGFEEILGKTQIALRYKTYVLLNTLF